MFGSGKKQREGITLLVIELTHEFLRGRGTDREFSLDSPLSQAGVGLDSVGCLELLAEIERRCRVKIPERHWDRVPRMTLGKLVDLVLKCG